MILSLVLCAASIGAPQIAAIPPEAPAAIFPVRAQSQDRVQEYEKKRKEAGKDPEQLWELYLWCDANALDKQGRSCLRAVIKADPLHRPAHEKLGHLEYDGKWFTTEKKLEKYKKENEERIAKEKGLARYQGEWVPKDDIPYLERGMIRDEEGEWVSAEEQEKIKGGWKKQDTVWIAPEEIPNIEKGFWKCGEKWLKLEDANRHHSDIGKWWIIPSDHFLLYTTCDRGIAEKALEYMDRAYKDVIGVLGVSPSVPVNVGMFRDLKQFSEFSTGSQKFNMTDARGLSSIHYAFFADLWFEPESLTFLGAGVGYWDSSTESGNSFGPHSARHAAAMSIIEAIDPSPKGQENVRKKKAVTDAYVKLFWGEKRLPEWYRYGVSSYADRYFVDQFVKRGGNPHWAREWSVSNLMSKGGLRPLNEVFHAELTVDAAEDSMKLLNERGLVMAFIVDGKCGPVAAKYGAVKHAIKKDGDLKKAFKDLEVEVIKNEKALREFAGI